jgi:hypothetical protein
MQKVALFVLLVTRAAHAAADDLNIKGIKLGMTRKQ